MAAVKLSRDGLAGNELEAKLAEVEKYAFSDYLVALAHGLESGRDIASAAVAQFTGLPIDLVRQHFARVPLSVFATELARAEGKVLSRYDGTIDTADIEPQASRSTTPDPVLDRSVPVLTAAFVDYARRELNYRTDISYRLLNRDVSGDWDYGTTSSRQGYAGALDGYRRREPSTRRSRC